MTMKNKFVLIASALAFATLTSSAFAGYENNVLRENLCNGYGKLASIANDGKMKLKMSKKEILEMTTRPDSPEMSAKIVNIGYNAHNPEGAYSQAWGYCMDYIGDKYPEAFK